MKDKLIALAKKAKDIFTKKKREYEQLQATVKAQSEQIVGLQSHCQSLQHEVDELNKFSKASTEAHFDLSWFGRDPHQVILLGNYRGQDFFRIYSVRADDFDHLVHWMKDMGRRHQIKTIETPRPEFKAHLEREFSRV